MNHQYITLFTEKNKEAKCLRWSIFYEQCSGYWHLLGTWQSGHYFPTHTYDLLRYKIIYFFPQWILYLLKIYISCWKFLQSLPSTILQRNVIFIPIIIISMVNKYQWYDKTLNVCCLSSHKIDVETVISFHSPWVTVYPQFALIFLPPNFICHSDFWFPRWHSINM